MKKPYLFIAILIVGILILTTIRLFLPSAPGIPQPGKPLLVVPPAPTMGITQPVGVTFSFTKEPSIPSVLPEYSYIDFTRGELEAKISSLAPEYGIPSTSSSLFRAGTFTREWSRDGATFKLHESETTAITFQQSSAPSAPSAPKNNPEAARNFLTKLLPVTAPLALTPAGITTDIPEGILITDSLGVRSLEGHSYSYTLDALPVVTYPYTSATSFVILDNFGIVRSATLHPAPKTVAVTGQVPILPPNDILTNLSAGRGALLSATTQESPSTAGTIAFKTFRIDTVTLVYARKDGFLLPAFILRGNGLAGGGTNQEATYFLWASPLQQSPTPKNN